MKRDYPIKSIYHILSILLLILLFSSCEILDFNKKKPSKNLIIEEEVEVASETISSSGGTLKVNAPGSEIDGLEIEVPSKSYSDSRTFKITTTAITSHNLGEYFNPITPLIQIENGGGYSDSIMEITIPIDIAEGEIPLGFFYDEITGKLEAVPVKDYTQKSITLLTRHFMSASELSPDNLKSGGIKIDATSNLIISSLSESVLKMQTIISSGFKMEVDNWEFVNQGSYLSDGGHCAGQNMTAMWYYFEKKLKGEGQLFGKYSTIASMDEDNAIGYRFCSVIQEDLSSEGKVISFFNKYIDKNQSLDKMKFYAIAGAMLTTGEPQGIGIYRTKDEDNDGVPDKYPSGKIKYVGHDLICYQIGINEGKLYICDPNYPKAGQIVEFENNKFKPYNGKANGHASVYKYPFVTWYAKTAWIDWPQVGKRYSELLDSTIGNKMPNNFPPYTIWVRGKVDSELKNGFTTSDEKFECRIECPTSSYGFNDLGRRYIIHTMYNTQGEIISEDNIGGNTYTLLKPGLNKIGFYVSSKKDGVVDKNGKNYPLYIDFKWFDIYYSKLKIEPNPIVGEPGDNLTITATMDGNPPAKEKYVWNFGDGTKEETVINTNSVEHIFSKAGNYTVTVDLYDNSTNTLIGNGFANANIVNGIMARLYGCKFISIFSNTEFLTKEGLDVRYGNSFTNTAEYPLVWDKNSFTCTKYYNELSNSKVSGTISDDGKKLLTLEYTEIIYPYNDAGYYKSNFTLVNVPYSWDYTDEEAVEFRQGILENDISKYFQSYGGEIKKIDGNGNTIIMQAVSINYGSSIEVSFSEDDKFH